jgi:hypothetical protein
MGASGERLDWAQKRVEVVVKSKGDRDRTAFARAPGLRRSSFSTLADTPLPACLFYILLYSYTLTMSARRSSSVEVVASDPAPAEPASAAKRKSAAATDDAPAPAPKRARAAPKKKPEPEPSRWPWIDRARPEMCVRSHHVIGVC